MRSQASRFRARKLSTKAALPILREADIDGVNEPEIVGDGSADAITSLPKVESGVESKEEREHHLQAVINAARAAAMGGGGSKQLQVSIPTPEAVASSIKYETMYPAHFAQPHTYIRFSSTVEDCIGCPYNMTAEDEIWLKAVNAKRAQSAQCTEDEFEQLISSFEEASAQRQPFAAVDNTPVLALEELVAAFDETVEERARKFAKEVYEYWKSERVKNGNRSLMPKLKTLKMDSGQDADDSDPYVCFRRREVRQVRKTRGRDAQVVEKLKKLRKELEDARQLLHLVKEREWGRKEDLTLSRQTFEQRTAVREMKRTHSIVDDDDDLITQRTPKRRPTDLQQQALRTANQGRLPGRQDSIAAPEADLVSFREVLARRERDVAKHISATFFSHEKWNKNYIDRTETELSTVFAPEDLLMDSDAESIAPGFVGVKSEYIQQPTPPPSDGSDSNDEEAPTSNKQKHVPVRLAKASEQKSFASEPRLRRRRGRNGRLFVDQRLPKVLDTTCLDDRMVDRFKYDRDDGDDSSSDDDVDVYSRMGFHYRAQWQEKLARQERADQLAAANRRAAPSVVVAPSV